MISFDVLFAATLLVASPLVTTHAFVTPISTSSSRSISLFDMDFLSSSTTKSSTLLSSSSSSFSSWTAADFVSFYIGPNPNNDSNEPNDESRSATTTSSFLVSSSLTDEQLWNQSPVPTFDITTDAYLNLPTLWSGSQVGQPSMMEILSRKEHELQNKLSSSPSSFLSTQKKQQQQPSHQEVSPVDSFFPVPTERDSQVMEEQHMPGEGKVWDPTTTTTSTATTAATTTTTRSMVTSPRRSTVSFESDGLMMVEKQTKRVHPVRDTASTITAAKRA
jgi:hypothetical protein